MHRFKSCAAALFILLPGLPCLADESVDCDSVAACLALAPASTAQVRGIDKVGQAIAGKISGFGPAALPELLKAMNTDNGHVRIIIDYAVGEMRNLAPADLALVQQIMRKDPDYSPGEGGFAYRAVGRIGTDPALRFLTAELVAANTAGNQIGSAFAELGEKGVPYLVAALRCTGKCEPDKFRGILEVFRELKGKAQSATGALLEIAQNKKLPVQARATAIRALGHVASGVKDIDQSVASVGRADKSVADDVRAALVELKSPLATDYLIKDLQAETAHDYSVSLHQLAALGPAGVAAGPAVLGFLQHANWDTRVDAALALGSIEYAPAVPELIKALADKTDWQLVYAAIASLSRLHDPSALKPLRETGESHWYPAVRNAAACAAQFIENGKNRCERHEEILDIDFLKLRIIGKDVGNCVKPSAPKVLEPEEQKQYGDDAVLQDFKYTGEECELPGDAGDPTSCLARRVLYPKIAARVADGWLTGRDEGEFGGEVMFFSDRGKPYKVLQENIEDIFVVNQNVFVIAGLAHMSTNNGMVYRLRQDTAGKWQAMPFLRLPGAPQSSYKTGGNRVLVKTQGGTIIFDEQGNTKMAVCGKSL